jgi:hypothetical protein
MLDSFREHASNALQWVASGSRITYAAVAVGVLIGLILFRFFFRSVAGLFHSIGFCFGSGGGGSGVDAAPGQCTYSRLKLLLIVLLPAGCAYAAYMLLPGVFPAVFK